MSFLDMKDTVSKFMNAQKEMKKIQKELQSMRITSETGGGTVKAIVDGEANLIDLQIDSTLLEKNELSLLPKMIVKTVQDAQKKAKSEAVNKAKNMAGLMNFPGMG